MFERARLRLTLLYIGLSALVLVLFSLALYGALATVLVPSFDIGPELTSEQAAQLAYQSTLQRVAIGLVVADVVTLLVVGGAAWTLASRTLRPVREALLRQRRFVADASHEMRTPLAVIRVRAEQAVADQSAPEELHAAVGGIVAAVDRLTRLTNDLLLLARADERLLDQRPQPLDLSVTVAEAMEDFVASHPAWRPARLALAPDVRVSADPDEIGRILGNLLDNALRHGDSGVAVSVSTFVSDGHAVLEVADAGSGIPAADLERVFEPFQRLQPTGGDDGGSGLGLAIARSLAERNGGRLIAASGVGAGAAFRLSLPRFT